METIDLSKNKALTQELMPLLLEERHSPRQSVIRRYLRYLQQWRLYLFKTWARLPNDGNGSEEIKKGVDDLISVALLTEYVRQYDSTAIPCLRQLAAQANKPSPHALFAAIQNAATSRLLRSVFEPDRFASVRPIPKEVIDLPWIERISRATHVTYPERVPVSLFGNFHQMCLGHCLVLPNRNDHRTPEGTVRRNRGIYYTPADLVDYLVYQTLRKAFDNCTPEDIKEIRVLDPSCGCGSFLVAALRYIFGWINEYSVHKGNRQKGYLSVQGRVDLVESMLFGSDIDPRAVEWTSRLLSLVVWESCMLDNVDTIEHCTVSVPDIRKNVVCVDFLAPSSEDGEQPRTWHNRTIHVVIGGPPFVRVEHLHKFQPEKITKYKQLYRTPRPPCYEPGQRARNEDVGGSKTTPATSAGRFEKPAKGPHGFYLRKSFHLWLVPGPGQSPAR